MQIIKQGLFIKQFVFHSTYIVTTKIDLLKNFMSELKSWQILKFMCDTQVLENSIQHIVYIDEQFNNNYNVMEKKINTG